MMNVVDHYTWNHSQSVSGLAQQIARQMGLPDSQIEEVRQGGIIHDVGTTLLPGTVRHKPSALTPEEYELMKSHPVRGAKILEPFKRERFAYYRVFPGAMKAIESIRGIVQNHHERWDGTGYPDGLKGEQIPIGARIVAVAESFDNMVSDLPYRRGRSTEETVAELRRCSGTQFDPDVVEAFVCSLELSPKHKEGDTRESKLPREQSSSHTKGDD
jgi:HD-GYP domain-containing protein (c-di-GMP phosphodiesterase class II)